VSRASSLHLGEAGHRIRLGMQIAVIAVIAVIDACERVIAVIESVPG
jgi:hypothetical protein